MLLCVSIVSGFFPVGAGDRKLGVFGMLEVVYFYCRAVVPSCWTFGLFLVLVSFD